MDLNRSSGILMHITSLPGPFGIGDLGPVAYGFVDFLSAAGYSMWQVLPVNPTLAEFNHSPYSSFSAFAGNPLLVSPELLAENDLVDKKEISFPKNKNPTQVNFEEVEANKNNILDFAFKKFQKSGILKSKYQEFFQKQSFWLDDYSLFQVLKKHFQEKSWIFWPEELKNRKPLALKEAREKFSLEIEKENFRQFLFFLQWNKLKEYAGIKGIKLFGDIPFYVNHDSVECWKSPNYFKLDKDYKPLKISGVPPDYFSETGQLWGTPAFDWQELEKNNFDWWIARIRQNLSFFDVVRLDHFRGFSATWEVPAGDKTAENGKWNKNPGNTFFKLVQKEFPEMPFIAEDLGTLDDAVLELIADFDFAGMKVLQFAFGDTDSGNPYLPYNYQQNAVVYTGTHDNLTSRAWFAQSTSKQKKHLREYTGKRVTVENVHRVLRDLALKSVAGIAIFPVQDILGLGEEAVMNIPGTLEGNWVWRLNSEEELFKKISKLKKSNSLSGRLSIKKK